MNWNKTLFRTTLILSASMLVPNSYAVSVTDIISSINGSSGDNHGWSVSLDGNTAIVGAYLYDNVDIDNNGIIDKHDGGNAIVDSGAAYIYVNDGFGNWTQQVKLNAYSGGKSLNIASHNFANVGPDNLPQRNAWFGYSVAISGDIAVVGSPYFDLSTEEPQPQIDTDNDGVADAHDAFPEDPSESLDSDEDGIGDNADTNADGTEEDENGNDLTPDTHSDTDGVIDTLDAFPNDGSESVDTDNDGIGDNTDIDDDGDGYLDINDPDPLDSEITNEVSEEQDVLDAGAIYIYERIGGFWRLTARFIIEEGGVQNGDLFGSSVAIHKNTIVIGALSEGRSGTVSILFRDTTGDWKAQPPQVASPDLGNSEVKALTAFDASTEEYYGQSVAIYDNTIVVGSSGSDTTGSSSGSVYVYTKDVNSNWNIQTKILPSSPKAFSNFGISVDIHKNEIIVGADNDVADNEDNTNNGGKGAAYVYSRDVQGKWTQQSKLIAPNGAAGDKFGHSVALYEPLAVVGAWAKTSDISSTSTLHNGAAYLYRKNNSGDWNNGETITPSANANFDNFGFSVDISSISGGVSNYWFAAGTPQILANKTGTLQLSNNFAGSIDSDEDGISNLNDTDHDNDGVLNANDGFPFDASAFNDLDKDGFSDDVDLFPNNAIESFDTDGDGLGNNFDTDDDGDGQTDQIELLHGSDPYDSTSTSSTVDTDGDGVIDSQDAFPTDSTETLDTDGDGLGNNTDADDDNDGVLDVDDAFPLDNTKSDAGAASEDNESTGGGGLINMNIGLFFLGFMLFRRLVLKK